MIDIYIGKHQSSKKLSRKALILIISLVLVFCAAVGGTIAFMLINTDSIENNFIPAKVVVSVNEDTTENTKYNISFTVQDGEDAIPAYVRATLATYWTDTIDGATVKIAQPVGASAPHGSLLNNGWFLVGDIYYYEEAIEPGKSTPVLMDTITVTLPDGSTAQCHIDVHAEAIQAAPAEAVEDAWTDIDVAGGKLVAHN
ncbi:MAG: hypothetical protein J6P94_02455 [Oscillospiraceae bacterium]|nr:hypothetical protein [Oscillospiraceae bacterium]